MNGIYACIAAALIVLVIVAFTTFTEVSGRNQQESLCYQRGGVLVKGWYANRTKYVCVKRDALVYSP